MRALGLLVLASAATIALGSGGSAPPVRLAAPAGVTAGLPIQVTVSAQVAPDAARIVARSGALRRMFSARRDGRGKYRATVALPQPGRWSLVARVGRLQSAPRNVTARAASARHPYAVTRAGGRTFVADGATGRVLQLGSRGLAVHARGLSEPTGLAAHGPVVYVADFAANLVRRVDARARVTTLAAVPQVASVAVARSGTLYAVAIDGPLVRISPAGAVTRIADLDRPHGVAVDRDGTLLVAENSTRVRRVDPANGRSELVVTSPGVNRIAVGPDGMLYLAGTTRDGGSLRRVASDGTVTTLIEDLRVADVTVLPSGDLIATAIEPGLVLRVDPRTGARTRLGG